MPSVGRTCSFEKCLLKKTIGSPILPHEVNLSTGGRKINQKIVSLNLIKFHCLCLCMCVCVCWIMLGQVFVDFQGLQVLDLHCSGCESSSPCKLNGTPFHEVTRPPTTELPHRCPLLVCSASPHSAKDLTTGNIWKHGIKSEPPNQRPWCNPTSSYILYIVLVVCVVGPYYGGGHQECGTCPWKKHEKTPSTPRHTEMCRF